MRKYDKGPRIAMSGVSGERQKQCSRCGFVRSRKKEVETRVPQYLATVVRCWHVT
jgi:hypothetical protein